jgi:hypothetical protein
LVSCQQFTDAGEAATAYAEAEKLHLKNSDVEIVLVGADLLETIEHTHGSYFDILSPAASPYLAGV